MKHEFEYNRLERIMNEIQELITDQLPAVAQGELVNAIAAIRRAQGHIDT
jgi:hypothetical protein